jgi:hypothetical protein
LASPKAKEHTSDKGDTGREGPQSCTLRVIKEVIINGKGDDEEDRGDTTLGGDGGSKEGENNRYKVLQQPDLPLLDMNKINMTFDPQAAPNGIENTR